MNLKVLFVLSLIVLLGLFLRFYQLDRVPPSLGWDEASTMWNAYTFEKTGTDEYARPFPLVSIRSFNDFKPPMYVYLTSVVFTIFGASVWAVRFVSAASAVVAIAVTYFLTNELFGKRRIALMAALFLAVSPWHLPFSRVAFEYTLALTLFMLGNLSILFFLKKGRSWIFFLALLFWGASMYTYHSQRLVVPLFVGGLAIFYWKRFTPLLNWKVILTTLILGIALLFPLIRSGLRSGGTQARFASVSIFSLPLKPLDYAQVLAANYLDHFNFDFLFLTGDVNPRHHAPDVGMLLLWDLPFLLAGIYFLLRHKFSWKFFLVWWVITAPVASALTRETPHAGRSLLLLPTFQIVIAYGLNKLNFNKLIAFGAVCLFTVNVFYFSHQYFVHLPIETAKDWQYGYREAVDKVKGVEQSYKSVYITITYDQPYIYFLLFGNYPPTFKNPGDFSRAFGKYHFVAFDHLSGQDLVAVQDNSLLITAPLDAIQPKKIMSKIYFPDGKVAFNIGTL